VWIVVGGWVGFRCFHHDLLRKTAPRLNVARAGVAPGWRMSSPFLHSSFSDVDSTLDKWVRKINVKGAIPSTHVCKQPRTQAGKRVSE
jgi:hypothetical protein